jgi:hypothetical protein
MANRSLGGVAAVTAVWLIHATPEAAADASADRMRLAVAPQSSLQERIVGAWRLVSMYEENEGGEDIAVFGSDPQGKFIATSGGQFSLQIVSREGRRLGANRNVITVSDGGDRLREALGYFGTYSLDQAGKTLNLRVSYCLVRSCDQSSRKASIEFVGDELIFTSTLQGTPTGSFYSRLVWARDISK